MVVLGVHKGYVKASLVEKFGQFKHWGNVALCWVWEAHCLRLVCTTNMENRRHLVWTILDLKEDISNGINLYSMHCANFCCAHIFYLKMSINLLNRVLKIS